MKFKNQLEVFTYLAEHHDEHDFFICHAISDLELPERLEKTCMNTMKRLRPKNGEYGARPEPFYAWWDLPNNDFEAELVDKQKKAFLRHVVNHLSKRSVSQKRTAKNNV